MKKFLGLIILAAVAVTTVYLVQQRGSLPSVSDAPKRDAAVLRGKIGSEKAELLADAAVVELLSSRFGLKVEAQKAGSVEMVREPSSGLDFLWPASEVNVEY